MHGRTSTLITQTPGLPGRPTCSMLIFDSWMPARLMGAACTQEVRMRGQQEACGSKGAGSRGALAGAEQGAIAASGQYRAG